MRFRSLLVTASLCFVSAVTQAGPLVVTFIPTTDNGQEAPHHGPKNQTGYYQFSHQDSGSNKQSPPAQPGGYGLANFPNQGANQLHPPEELPPLAQHTDQDAVFSGPGQSIGNHGALPQNKPNKPNGPKDKNDGPGFNQPSEVPEPGSLPLLLLSLIGLAALGLRQRARS